uniref:Cadherin domain-containing protein n=1 Tax=Rousettus aegyptiacus TaxID=9407 RepID=A0A7J8FL13_ROUAE|nr:hypothetical protein HJG63_014987 [Rousettus aegyptiacus]
MELAGTRPGATEHPRLRPPMSWLLLLPAPLLLLLLPGPAASQLRYSVPEEQTPGALVGNVASALGLELRRLGPGCLRINHLGAPSPRYLELDLTSGALFVNERIDREALCEQRPRCLLSLEVLAHNPVAVSAVEVEVLDINDNSPRFPRPDYQLQPRQPNPDWRYSASLRAGMHSSVHLEEAGILRAGPGGPDQQWPTVSSATPEPEAGEVSPPVGAGVNSNSWTFKYGPGNPKQSGPEPKKQTQVSFLLRRKGEASQPRQ